MSSPVSGIPKVVEANTTASAFDALAVLSPIEFWNAGGLVKTILAHRDNQVCIAIDPFALKLYATEVLAVRNAFRAAIPLDVQLVVRPISPGFIVKWEVHHNDGFPDQSAFFHQLNKRTVVQVVNTFCRKLEPTFALIDQFNGWVEFRNQSNPAAVSAALAAVVPSGFTVCYDLTRTGYGGNTFEN